MQELDMNTLLKSTSFNIFYPRIIKENELRFSYKLNDLHSQAFISEDFDELGYARRYTTKYLFYKANNLNQEVIIKANIYGCDGIVLEKIKDKHLLQVAKNNGLYLAYIINNNFKALKASLLNIDICICNKDLKIKHSKIKGIL